MANENDLSEILTLFEELKRYKPLLEELARLNPEYDSKISELLARIKPEYDSKILEVKAKKERSAWDIAIDANPPIFRVYNAPEGRRYQIDGVDTAQNGFWLDRWKSEIDKHNKAFPLNKVTLPPDQEMFQKIVTNQLKPYGSLRSFTTNALNRNKKIY